MGRSASYQVAESFARLLKLRHSMHLTLSHQQSVNAVRSLTSGMLRVFRTPRIPNEHESKPGLWGGDHELSASFTALSMARSFNRF